MKHTRRRRIQCWPLCWCTLSALLLGCTAARSVSLLLAQGLPATAQGGVASGDIWRGVFTDRQAERGKAVFDAHCARCHDANELGEAPTLAGDTFLRGWEGHTLGQLYTKILEMMPPPDAQSVDARDKLDVMTFILRENGFPSGAGELTADSAALGAIRIVPEGGPAQLRSGATVQVVGCLTRPSPNTWLLTSSTEPEATTLQQSGAEDQERSRTRTLGNHTIRLVSVFPSPEALTAHRVEAKGLLVRTGTDLAVNVVTLRSVATTCP
jgi:hypothetical protein